MSIKNVHNSLDFEQPEFNLRKQRLENVSVDIVSSSSRNGDDSSEASFAGATRIRQKDNIKLFHRQNKVGSAVIDEISNSVDNRNMYVNYLNQQAH